MIRVSENIEIERRPEIKNISPEKITETIINNIKKVIPYKDEIIKYEAADEDEILMKVDFEIKPTQEGSPDPKIPKFKITLGLIVKGNKNNFEKKLQEEISEEIAKKNLSEPQTLGYLDVSFHIFNSSKAGSSKHFKRNSFARII